MAVDKAREEWAKGKGGSMHYEQTTTSDSLCSGTASIFQSFVPLVFLSSIWILILH